MNLHDKDTNVLSNDCISRQEALDALGEEPLVWTDSEGEIAERNQWRMDVAAIKAVPSAQHWIPCSERKPPDEIDPYTMDYKLYVCSCVFGVSKDVRTYKYGNGHFWNGPGIMDEYVVAWMPLPKPWEGDKNE